MALGDFLKKLEAFKNGLENWARQMQRNKKWRKEFLTAKLSKVLAADRDDNNLAEMIDAKIQLNFEIEKDERYWEQRAKLNWLKLGDKNTTFFHGQATQRQRKNLINKLQNDNGCETGDLQEMESIARSYFQTLFTLGNQRNYDCLLSGTDRCVFEEDNRKLTVQYTKE